LRKATLGTFAQMSLAEARIAAGKIFEQLADDIDPREAERQAAAEATASLSVRMVPAIVAADRRRRSELATLWWADVDLAEKSIVIPADRYKTGRAHMIPLSRQALTLLEGLPRVDANVFPGRGGGKPIAAFTSLRAKIDALLDPPIDYNLHDTRRTCRTGLSRLRVAPHVAECVLGHAQQGIERVYDVYSYADEKRQALQLWADHVSRIASGYAGANNVVTLTPRA
jgi:integrase